MSNMYYHVWVLYQSLYVPDFMQSVKQLCEAYSISRSILHVGELRPCKGYQPSQSRGYKGQNELFFKQTSAACLFVSLL